MRPKGTAEELERRRRLAMALLEEGSTQAEVARTLETSTASVSRWKQAYEQDGETALSAKPHPGRRPKLTAKQQERLANLLLRGPRNHGCSTDLRTLSRVAQEILTHLGVSYDPSGVWHMLRRLGWSCQKPERRARERDEDAIATWRQVD